MKTFAQFITEAERSYDPDVIGRSQIHTTSSSGRVGGDRRKSQLTTQLKQHKGQKPKVKAIGGGKTAPAKPYKKRSDVGTQRQTSTRVQQPTKERGSAALSAKEAQKKAYLERKAKERGAKTKSASELLAKKAPKKVDPKYKPAKASGYTRPERKALYRKGERALRDLVLQSTGKKKESELKNKYTSK